MICEDDPVETVTTPAWRFTLCADHVTKFASCRLSDEERALLLQKKQPAGSAWQPAVCALCVDPADLIFTEKEGTFAFCQPHFIRYVLLALHPNEHSVLSGRLTPDQFLTRLSTKYYFEGVAEQPYFEDLDDPAYSVATPLWET
ncbi:MAG TPA: hypothetical protein VE201_01235 [Nitrospirales bacterium]|nr:hypothetical protein [Nitrospirales bacterium]